jgi:hypothetical protein
MVQAILFLSIVVLVFSVTGTFGPIEPPLDVIGWGVVVFLVVALIWVVKSAGLFGAYAKPNTP